MNTSGIISNVVLLLLPIFIAVSLYCYKAIEQNLPEKQRAALTEITRMAVYSVEQQYSSVDSEHKKNAAVNMVGNIFRAFKLPIPEMYIISAAIEACILEMNMFQNGSGGDDLLPIFNPRSPLPFHPMTPAPPPTQLPPSQPSTPLPAGPTTGGDNHAS